MSLRQYAKAVDDDDDDDPEGCSPYQTVKELRQEWKRFDTTLHVCIMRFGSISAVHFTNNKYSLSQTRVPRKLHPDDRLN
jgi:hypothetical protein